MIHVDPSSRQPLYQQIVDAVRLRVARGQLHAGDRLEPVRQMADRLQINASTVAHAYQLLEREGVIQTNRRGGSVVARQVDDDSLWPVRETRLRGIVERALVEALAQGYAEGEVEVAFGLQIAAWRERRRGALEVRPAPAEFTRLARFAGSHDLAFEALLAQARQQDPEFRFTTNYVGSLDGLAALLHGEVALAGAHILDEDSGLYNLPILHRLFPQGGLSVVTLVEREQGLIVADGNPKGIVDLAGLTRPGVRFINRQPGSGTRTLLDFRLRQACIVPDAIGGYQTASTTHLGVAAAIADGQADAGLGLYAAARAYGLGFVPLAHERYDLVFFAEDRRRPPLSTVLDSIATPHFRALVAEMGGYDVTHMGEETNL